MYLRNKKTGEVVDWSFVGPTAIKEYEGKDVLLERERYESIEEFISEWEDYVPKEPLIPDTECREIMRLWADRCGVKSVMLLGSEFRYGTKSICFGTDFGLEHLNRYTIDELCGEEEE